VRRLTGLLFVALLLVAVSNSIAQDNTEESERIVPEVKAYRINPHPPSIDGNLDDDIWNSDGIEYIRDFTQRDPDEGKAATESTVVAVVYDDEAIYFAFWCYDSEPEKVTKRLARRDRWVEADRAIVRIDPYHDHLTGYQFDINASGVMRDLRLYNDDHMDGSWNAVWEAESQVQPWGWSAEFKIPYHCMRFNKKDSHIWGLDVVRYISRKEEAVRWAYTPREDGGFVRNFGHLTNLNAIEPARHLEILPYTVGQIESEVGHAGNPDGRDYFGNMGVDLKYGLSSDLTLDLTVNPDFGQVELDRPVLNLSTYETYFPERRPFFLEGNNLFRSEFNTFYSRRIGRQPQWYVDDDDYLYSIRRPKATTILGAGKITGKLAGGTSFAFITAFTDQEEEKYARGTNKFTDSTLVDGEWEYEDFYADTVEAKQVVEPRANYSVLRVKQDILGNSTVGGILTVASQKSYHPSVVGGIDWRLNSANGVWLFKGQALMNNNEEGDPGYGIDFSFHKESGKHIRAGAGLLFRSPELSLNRLGFNSRPNTKHPWFWMQYRTNDDWWIFRNTYNNINWYAAWNYDDVMYMNGANYNCYWEFINYWSMGWGVEVQMEKYSDRETRGNGIWEWPNNPTVSWWMSLNTDQRKPISFNWNPGSGTDRGGTWWANYMGVEIRPTTNVEIDLGTNFVWNGGQRRWVTNEEHDSGDTSVFADMSRRQVTFHVSTAWLVNRDLSFQLSAEGLISGIDYGHYRRYQGGNSYGPTLAGFDDYDYNYSALNSTMLIRWEYLPGSTMYLVWTRARSQFDDQVNNLDFNRDFDRFFSKGAENLFLIKASYWLNM